MTRWGAAVLERLHLEQLSEQDRQPFLREVMRQLGEPVIDYVRLNLLARRGGDG